MNLSHASLLVQYLQGVFLQEIWIANLFPPEDCGKAGHLQLNLFSLK